MRDVVRSVIDEFTEPNYHSSGSFTESRGAPIPGQQVDLLHLSTTVGLRGTVGWLFHAYIFFDAVANGGALPGTMDMQLR